MDFDQGIDPVVRDAFLQRLYVEQQAALSEIAKEYEDGIRQLTQELLERQEAFVRAELARRKEEAGGGRAP